jgi:DNA invertase Pin-like site-specific DNA recombinase
MRTPNMLVGYARTSTTDQKAGLAAQERDLRAAGCEKVFAEQVSSVAQRDKLQTCLNFVREGDVLVVTKPDRLARSTAELLAIESELSKRGIGLVILSMGGERLDTRNPTSKLMLTVLAGVAQWEREMMLERQREGIEGQGGRQVQRPGANGATPGGRDHAAAWRGVGPGRDRQAARDFPYQRLARRHCCAGRPAGVAAAVRVR